MARCRMKNPYRKWAWSALSGRLLICGVWMSAAFALMGSSATAELTEEQIASRAKEIDKLIMSPCCWTQPVSDHYSGVASEIRQGIRKMLAEGKTRDEIVDFYIGKYGERILSLPKAEGFNLMAYLLPAMALLVGAIVVRAIIKAWHRPAVAMASGPPAEAPSDDYARRLAAELKARE